MTALVYDIIYILPVCMLSVIGTEPYLRSFFEEDTKRSPVWFTAAVICICCFSVKHLKGRYKLIIPGVALTLCAGAFLKYGNEEGRAYLYDHRWVLWVMLTVIAAFFIGWAVSVNRYIRAGAALILLGGLIYFMICGPAVEKKLAVPAIFILLVTAADIVQRHWVKSGYTDEKGHIVSVTPFILLLAVMIFIAPAPDKPYDWRITRTIISRIADGINAAGRLLRSKDEDYGGVMGFSDNNSYFGDLFSKEREVMRVTTDGGTGPLLYLSARVLDDFDGRKWTKEYYGEYEDRRLDSIETVSAVMQYEADYTFDYYKCIQVRVEYLDFNTGYFFAPSKMLYHTTENEKEKYTERGFELTADKKLGYGTEYVITYIRTNDHNAAFYPMTDAAETTDKEAWNRARHWLGYVNDGVTELDDYHDYVGRMYKYYLPHTEISERAKTYLDKLTEGAGSDMEKLKAIEKALSAYGYTLSPGELPEETDSETEFLDRILFETKQGYCTHYATAFVIMARSLGIPARFVQGFRVPVKAGQTVSVMSSMSHAWPEAYIDGAGWIAFEPTPGMLVDSKWMFSSRVVSDDEDADDEEEDEEETQTAPVTDREMHEAADTEEEKERIDWQAVVIPSAMVVLFLLCFILFDRILQRRRYNRMNDDEKFKLCCRRNFKALTHLGYRLMPGETLEEFAHRCTKELEPEKDGVFGFVEVYERMLYAGDSAGPEDIAAAAEDLDDICMLIRYYRGRLPEMMARL